MKLQIKDEYSKLKSVIVGTGKSVPLFETYKKSDYDYLKEDLSTKPYNKKLLEKQQTNFLNVLKKHGVKLLMVKEDEKLPWQMWTRDTGFVYKNKFFYCVKRGLKERELEFNAIAHHFSKNSNQIVCINKGKLEGGDVVVDKDIIYIGISRRTGDEAVKIVEKYFPVKKLNLGNSVMHLDTRMTILPNNNLLIYQEAFQKEDLKYLQNRFNFIPVTKEEEAQNLGTNVFVINSNTIVVHKAHTRIHKELQKRKFKLEIVDYSESIRLEGSFRCTTLPVERENINRSTS